MSKAIQFVTVPIGIVALLAGYLFFSYMPKNAKLPSFSGQAVGDEKIYSEVFMVHSDRSHDPYTKGSTAETIVKKTLTGWPGKPDGENWRCFSIFVAKMVEGKMQNIVLRTVFWKATGNGLGELSWFNNETGRWGGAFSDKPGATAGKLPYDMKENENYKGAKIQGGCNHLPPGGGLPPLATN